MTCDLKTIKDRYDRVCNLADTDPASATTAAALRYSWDVPALIEEVESLRAYIARAEGITA